MSTPISIGLPSYTADGIIQGLFWHDLNGDGIKDDHEMPLSGYQVYLDDNQNNQLDPHEQSVITDTEGKYSFSELLAGTYYVNYVPSSEWEQTYPISNFNIELIYKSDITSTQRAIFTEAANRWEQIIIADIPDVTTVNGIIDDLAIDVEITDIDGRHGILGQAGILEVREDSFLPYRGIIRLDSEDIADLEQNSKFQETIVHEMAHLLGFGKLWQPKELIQGIKSSNPRFIGEQAVKEYNDIFQNKTPFIPVESDGGTGTAYFHWDEKIFFDELMTGFLNVNIDNPLSRISIASMADIGYQVDLDLADPYSPPVKSFFTASTDLSLELERLDNDLEFQNLLETGVGEDEDDDIDDDIDDDVQYTQKYRPHRVVVEAEDVVENVDFGLKAVSLNNTETIMGEFGTIDNLNHLSQTISLNHTYTNPVVFAQPLSFNGADPAIVRLDNISSDSFQLQVQEPNYKDGQHIEETVSYIVLEAGTWELADGTKLEVGKVDSNKLVHPNLSSWEKVSFSQNFDATPVVFSQVQTKNDDDFVNTRMENIDKEGFLVGMEEEEAHQQPGHPSYGHNSESIGYFALETGGNTWGDYDYLTGYTGDVVSSKWEKIDFDADFSESPQFLASIASYNGIDSISLRYKKLTDNQVQIKVHEDTSQDFEMGHIPENLSFFALDGTSGLLTATS